MSKRWVQNWFLRKFKWKPKCSTVNHNLRCLMQYQGEKRLLKGTTTPFFLLIADALAFKVFFFFFLFPGYCSHQGAAAGGERRCGRVRWAGWTSGLPGWSRVSPRSHPRSQIPLRHPWPHPPVALPSTPLCTSQCGRLQEVQQDRLLHQSDPPEGGRRRRGGLPQDPARLPQPGGSRAVERGGSRAGGRAHLAHPPRGAEAGTPCPLNLIRIALNCLILFISEWSLILLIGSTLHSHSWTAAVFPFRSLGDSLCMVVWFWPRHGDIDEDVYYVKQHVIFSD